MKRLFSSVALILFILSFTSFFTTAVRADDAPIKIQTTLTDKVSGDDAVGEKDAFSKDTNEIFLVSSTDEMKKGQTLKAIWIADDTKNVAPPHYEIAEKTFTMDQDLGVGDEWTVKFSLTKPTAGWPLGQYHVDVYADNKLLKAVKFTISDVAPAASTVSSTTTTTTTSTVNTESAASSTEKAVKADSSDADDAETTN